MSYSTPSRYQERRERAERAGEMTAQKERETQISPEEGENPIPEEPPPGGPITATAFSEHKKKLCLPLRILINLIRLVLALAFVLFASRIMNIPLPI